MRRLTLLACLCLLLLPAVYAAEPTQKNSTPKFSLKVRVIKASKQKKPVVDPKLSDIAKRLQKLVDYNHYKFLDSKQFKLTPHQKISMQLPSDRSLEITFKRFDEKRKVALLKLKILRTNPTETLLSTEYKVSLGVPLIVGGMKLKNGQSTASPVLVLAIELHAL